MIFKKGQKLVVTKRDDYCWFCYEVGTVVTILYGPFPAWGEFSSYEVTTGNVQQTVPMKCMAPLETPKGNRPIDYRR